jgi:hypothetical protein
VQADSISSFLNSRRSEIVVEEHLPAWLQGGIQFQHCLPSCNNPQLPFYGDEVVSEDDKGMNIAGLAGQCPYFDALLGWLVLIHRLNLE